MARLVVPGYPHHVTQRGNRCQQTFFEDSDYRAYIELLAKFKDRIGVSIWAYCLMPNHVHLVAVPRRREGLAKLFGLAHHRYARRINVIHGWQGHLWQERFYSFVMDETHLLATVRYVELNPVRAGLCDRAEDWPWSSVHAHAHNAPDGLVTVAAMRERIADWSRYLAEPTLPDEVDRLREHTQNGRPAGDAAFIDELEALTGRSLQRSKPQGQ